MTEDVNHSKQYSLVDVVLRKYNLLLEAFDVDLAVSVLPDLEAPLRPGLGVGQ